MTLHGQIKRTGLLYIKPISGLWRILMDSAVKASLIREQKMESLAWCLAPNFPNWVILIRVTKHKQGISCLQKQNPSEKNLASSDKLI